MRCFINAFCIVVFASLPALAQQAAPPAATAAPNPGSSAVVGQQHDNWAAFAFDDSGTPTCYATTKVPTKGGEAFIYITHRPTENAVNVFQFLAPFALQTGSKVTLQIDRNGFTLFADASSAWARGSETDRAIVDAIRRGRKLSVTAAQANGKPVSLNFDMKGSSLALQAINKMCGLAAQ